MKLTTLSAILVGSTLMLFSCGEHAHNEDGEHVQEESKAVKKQVEQEATKAIKDLDQTLKEVQSKEAEVDAALEDLDF